MGLEAIARRPISSSWWRGWVCASFRGLEMKVRRADIVITINTNTTPSSEVELPIIWFTDYSVQHSLLNRTLKPTTQSSTQISIIIHGNHPWSYEKISETPSEYLTFIFKISDLRSIKERPLSWRSYYQLSTAHLRRQIQVGEGVTNSKFHHYWYTTIFIFPRPPNGAELMA